MSDHSLPDLNVLIRTTGRAELFRALSSVAAQDYPLDRIAVTLLDARETHTQPLHVPEDFPLKIKIITPETPKPRAQAANLLLEAAEGDYAIFLDDDDTFEPHHLLKLATAAHQAPTQAVFYTGVRCLDERQNELRRYDEPFNRQHLLIENYLPIHGVLFKLAAIRQHKIQFDPNFDLFEDWDFWLQCLIALGDFQHIAGVSAIYNIHGQSGVGVRLHQAEYAERALTQILEKWRTRLPIQDMRDLVGYARQVKALQHHLHQLTTELANIHTYYQNSRSWRITQPLRDIATWLRAARDQSPLKSLKASTACAILDLATRVYRSPLCAPLMRYVPSSFKRHLRNQLMTHAHVDVPPITTGVYVTRPVGAQPLVSIIIPVYNHAAYIEACIRSALAQEECNVEVIVVNDASPDPAVRPILDQLAAEFPHLNVYHRPQNGGICQAQNDALIRSRGEIIAFLDCDDYLPPHALSTSLKHWRDDTVYLHTGRINVDENNKEINRIHFADLPRQDYFNENLRAMYATHLKLIRRDAFARVGLFDPRFDSAQDYDMLMRIAFHYPSSSFVHVPEFLYFHRLHSQQTTHTQNTRQTQLTAQIQREARLRAAIRQGQFDRFISIIMLSYGKHTQTLAAIQGLQATVRVPHEIILYDNGSAPETVEFLRQHIDGQFEQVRVFYGDRNLGPAQGRRVALEHARGEWFIIFDNDEIPEDGWLEELLVRAHSHEQVGAVCCRVVFPDKTLQFSGGLVRTHDHSQPDVIDLALFDRGAHYEQLETCVWREVDWCPIGATLFTQNIAPYLHDGYPNTFEDAGVSFALKKQGLKLLNAPSALVWHDHITFRPRVEMRAQYLRDRYQPQMMLKSVATFWQENQLLIYDEYIWRENRLLGMSRPEIEAQLHAVSQLPTRF